MDRPQWSKVVQTETPGFSITIFNLEVAEAREELKRRAATDLQEQLNLTFDHEGEARLAIYDETFGYFAVDEYTRGWVVLYNRGDDTQAAFYRTLGTALGQIEILLDKDGFPFDYEEPLDYFYPIPKG